MIDDHAGAACERDQKGECAHCSGEVSWPVATLGKNLETGLLLDTFEEIA